MSGSGHGTKLGITDGSGEAILRFRRERRRRCGNLVPRFMRIAAERLAEKEQLIFVALAPFADQKMQPHFDADSDRQRAIHGVR